jgi:DNA-directed RNA polymerase specialized sigma24 family protein
VRGRLTITTGTDGQEEHSPSHGPDEGELLGRLRTGDEEAFACLVDRHHATMVRFARGYVRSPSVAEEVAQDAWLGLLRGLDRFEGRSSLRTWLFPIVAARVRQLVEDLPPAQRQVVTLRDVEGLPTADVCSILGISEGNQRVLLHRARARIRRHIEQEAVW